MNMLDKGATKISQSVSHAIEYNGMCICQILQTVAGRWALILQCNANRTELTARISGNKIGGGGQRHLVISNTIIIINIITS